jgi:plasmid stabilization system protein ParE
LATAFHATIQSAPQRLFMNYANAVVVLRLTRTVSQASVSMTNMRYALRKLSVHGYLIFDAVKAKSIDIMRVVHGSVDWMTLFDIPLE